MRRIFMPRHFRLTGAVALCGALALTAFTQMTMAGGPTTDSMTISDLQAKGFKTRAVYADGEIIAMSYSGPATGAVVCGRRGGPTVPLGPRILDLDGVVKRATLDVYVTLREGKVVDGIYALVLRAPGPTLEGIDFGPGESKSFVSGLTCTSA
jgi:hypothetical protein